MGRGRAKTRRVTRIEVVDATPERIRMDESEFVNPAEIDSSEQNIGLTRRFRASHLDRLYRAERLTYRQYYAGDWYRNQHAACAFDGRVTASYSGSSTGGGPTFGLLPKTERQLVSRRVFHEARKFIGEDMVGYVDRLVLRNAMPSLRHRGTQRTLEALQLSLDKLANFLRYPANQS